MTRTERNTDVQIVCTDVVTQWANVRRTQNQQYLRHALSFKVTVDGFEINMCEHYLHSSPQPYYKGLLFAAAVSGRMQLIERLVPIVGVDAINKRGETPLVFAARHGQLQSAQLLLEQGAKIEHRDHEGNTCLMHAVTNPPNSEMIAFLLSKGADVQMRNNEGVTALMMACTTGDSQAVLLLLNAGSDVNAVSSCFETPLTFAIVWNHVDVIQHLLKYGASTKFSDQNGWTPMKYAAFEKNSAVIRLLKQ